MKYARPGADESMSPRKGELTGAGGEEQSVNNVGAGQVKVTGIDIMGNDGSGGPRFRQQVEHEASRAARAATVDASALERGDGPLRGHMSARDARKRAQVSIFPCKRECEARCMRVRWERSYGYMYRRALRHALSLCMP